MFPLETALAMARQRQLDLVEIAGNADPPVVKIMDFGKFRYEQQKKEKEARKKQARTSELKEIRFRPNTDDHDLDFMAKHAGEFRSEGKTVRPGCSSAGGTSSTRTVASRFSRDSSRRSPTFPSSTSRRRWKADA